MKIVHGMIAVLATISSQSRLNRALILTSRGRDTLLKRTNDVHMKRFAGHFGKYHNFLERNLISFRTCQPANVVILVLRGEKTGN